MVFGMMAEKNRIKIILYSICALLLLSGAVYGAVAWEKLVLSSSDPTAVKWESGKTYTFYTKIQDMSYSLVAYYENDYQNKGPHLLFTFNDEWSKSPDINSDGSVNYYDFIDSILPIADFSNAKGSKYDGEGNVYLKDFQFTITKDGTVVKTVTGNFGVVSSSMTWADFTYQHNDDKGAMIGGLIVDAPGTYTVSYSHPKLGSKNIASFTLSEPGVTSTITSVPSRGKQYIWIETEDEAGANVQKPGTSWDSIEEKNPSWRLGLSTETYSGTGDWYLSREGDTLTYNVNVPETGSYVFWMRDWTDKKHPFGSQEITITIDGTTVGNFNEHTGDVGYGWQKLTSVSLSAGSHTLKITKTQTTSSAAILDAMLLTTDASYTPSGKVPSIPAGDTPVPSTTGLTQGTATLKIHPDTGEVFSFDIGSVESFWGGQTKGDVSIEYSEGNIKSTKGIPETIQDAGTASLNSLTTAPTTGYMGETSVIQGHSYWVKTSGGKYAKIYVKSVDTSAITFDWVLQPDGSTNFGTVKPPITPPITTTSGTELVTNGDLSKGLNGWTIEEWFKPSDGKGEVTAESDGIRFLSTSGNSRIGIMQTLNADVSKCSALNLRATIKADEQTLSGTGWNGRESPIAVFARYTDVNGVVHGNLGEDPKDAKRIYWYGLYFIDPTGQSITDFGIKTQKGEWYTYEADLMKLSPKPKTIDFIGAEGAGWATRSGKIKSISLTCAAAGVIPPVPVTEPNYLYAENRTVAAGENVLVPINIKNAKNIGNMDILINYDPKVLKPTEVLKGSLTGDTMFESNIQTAPEIRISFASTKGVNGDGSIAYINFQAVGSAGSTSRITFVDVLANEAGTMTKLSGKSTDADVKVVASVNVRKGDVNGDGKISSVDALMALKMSVRTIPATAAADVDGDGRVTSIDAGKILQAATGKITL